MNGIYLIVSGGGYVEIFLAIYLFFLYGISGVVAYLLSGMVASLFKRKQTLARVVVWSILFPFFVLLLATAQSPVRSGSGGLLGGFLYSLQVFFWYDPSLPVPYFLITISIWLLGVVLLAEKTMHEYSRDFQRRKQKASIARVSY